MTVRPSVLPVATGIALGQMVLSDSEFEKIVEFVYRKTGMRFADIKRAYVDKRVVECMAVSGSATFGDYFLQLRLSSTPLALPRLIEALTVNETYFFRENYQFTCLVRDVLPEIAGRKPVGSRIRIWSIPCSTGEEPFSIAISMLESWPDVDRHEVEITGADIDTNVLARARIASYGARAFQKTPDAIRQRYFVQRGPDSWTILPEIRGSIDFVPLNVADAADMRQVQGADVIFCRNMLIYFDAASQRQAVQALYETLVPGGFLFLGHSESMSRMSSSFRLRKFQDAMVYQRPIQGQRP